MEGNSSLKANNQGSMILEPILPPMYDLNEPTFKPQTRQQFKNKRKSKLE